MLFCIGLKISLHEYLGMVAKWNEYSETYIISIR